MTSTVLSAGLHVVMDLVPNHSSDEHEWFVKSVAKEDPYTEYYVWAPPSGYDEAGDPLPPNNWVSRGTMIGHLGPNRHLVQSLHEYSKILT